LISWNLEECIKENGYDVVNRFNHHIEELVFKVCLSLCVLPQRTHLHTLKPLLFYFICRIGVHSIFPSLSLIGVMQTIWRLAVSGKQQIVQQTFF
jgi:hypothetical protein